jgi:hypothetical protein
VTGLGVARLAHARVQAEIPDQLARGREAADVADSGQERRRGVHADARHGHQSSKLRRRERLLGQRPGPLRPALPKQSLIGGRPQRLRASTACASFFARVRARTRLSRRARTRRSARISSVGAHTVSSSPAAASRASVRASSRSVLAF